MSEVQVELARIERAEEEARGSALRELFLARRQLLEEHGTELMGPVASFAKEHPSNITWREGFVDGIVRPSDYKSEGQLIDPLPLSSLLSALELPAFSRCRSIFSSRWRGAPPPSTERLTFQQAVITEAVIALERLRELRVGAVVASVPLSHAGLEKLAIGWAGPAPAMLDNAELPALKMLAVTGLGRDQDDPRDAARTIARTRAESVFLGIHGKMGRAGWGAEEVSALEPIADRVVGMQWFGTAPALGIPLPKLRRLRLDLRVQPGPRPSPIALPDLEVEEVDVLVFGRGPHMRTVATQLAESRLVRGARVLHLRASDRAFVALFERPLERIEELSFSSLGTAHVAVGDEIFQKGSLPSLRTLSLAAAPQLPGVANSAVAARIEQLSIQLQGPSCVSTWIAVREKFPRLRTLVARGARRFDAESRAALYDGDHRVIWAENDAEERRRFFDTDRGAPGLAGLD